MQLRYLARHIQQNAFVNINSPFQIMKMYLQTPQHANTQVSYFQCVKIDQLNTFKRSLN